MMRAIFVIFGVLGIMVGTGGLIFLMGVMKPKVEKTEPVIVAPAVFVETVKAETVSLSVIAQGEVKPETEITLTAQVSGKIVAVAENFNDGGIIIKGERMIQIEDTDYRVALAQSKARLAQAEQAFRVAEVEADLAAQDFSDMGTLENGGELSPLALRLPQLEQARASLAAAKADVDNAQLNLSRTSVRAPFHGRIRHKSADVGQFVGPGTPIAQIFSTDVALIRVPLSDQDFARLGLPLAFAATKQGAQGPKVILTADMGGKTLAWEGHVVRTDAAIDSTTRQIAAIVEVRDPYGNSSDHGFPLAMGLFVTAEILGQTIENGFVLPRIAVQNDNTVYVVDADNLLQKKEIVVGAAIPRGIVVTGGLVDGDKVVVSRLGGATIGNEVLPLAPGEQRPPVEKAEPKPEELKAEAVAESGGSTSTGNGGEQ